MSKLNNIKENKMKPKKQKNRFVLKISGGKGGMSGGHDSCAGGGRMSGIPNPVRD